jgi:RNA recognition motif-containing protein
MSRKLFVGNLPYSATDQQLTDTFSAFGNVVSAKIILDRETGRSRGFAFLEMETDEAGAAAMQALNGSQLGGRTIVVREAVERQPGGGPVVATAAAVAVAAVAATAIDGRNTAIAAAVAVAVAVAAIRAAAVAMAALHSAHPSAPLMRLRPAVVASMTVASVVRASPMASAASGTTTTRNDRPGPVFRNATGGPWPPVFV